MCPEIRREHGADVVQKLLILQILYNNSFIMSVFSCADKKNNKIKCNQQTLVVEFNILLQILVLEVLHQMSCRKWLNPH